MIVGGIALSACDGHNSQKNGDDNKANYEVLMRGDSAGKSECTLPGRVTYLGDQRVVVTQNKVTLIVDPKQLNGYPKTEGHSVYSDDNGDGFLNSVQPVGFKKPFVPHKNDRAYFKNSINRAVQVCEKDPS